MQKVKLIYNPSSGEAVIQENLDNIISIYQKKGLQLIIHRLTFETGSEDSIIFDLDNAASYHHILIAGGDGTVNYVINILRKNSIDIPVALLPVGTANDFSLNIGMSPNVEKSCRKILSGEIIKSDLGMANGQYFVNILGFGLFSDLSLKTPTILKNYFGKLAYYVGGIGELTKLRKMNIKLTSDGGDFEGECYMVLIFNGQTAGSLKIAQTADISDGKLDVLIVRVGTLETMQTIVHFLSFKNKSSKYPAGMTHLQCSKIHIESPRNEAVDIDGEVGPEFPLDILCEKSAFSLIVPKAKTKPAKKTKTKNPAL